ncbi:MAG: DUF1801 domain-containing protein [Arenimonas sp.]|nr:DUF1801 domain-containing protein [Arenimonas sp.]MBP6626844.1 DUF1801 domain-containing protein [Arenimonas sp.]
MPEAKTQPTAASVDATLAARATAAQLADCRALIALMARVTQASATMWGPSIVGFGSYRYRYESGRTGESCLTGFAVRGKDLVVYLVAEDADQQARLVRLGKHKMGKSCLYFKRLADLDLAVLEALVAASVAETRRRHPAGPPG